MPRGLAYGKEGNKQSMCSRAGSFVGIVVLLSDRNAEKRDDENDDDNRYDTPNLRGTRGKVETLLLSTSPASFV